MTAPHVQGLPLVAHRGLWDRFAPPASTGAVARAYRRGVPSLARIADAPLDVWLSLALETPRAGTPLPLFVVAATLPAIGAMELPGHLPLLSVEQAGATMAWPISRWQEGHWQPAGLYLPVDCDVEALAWPAVTGLQVLFESANVASCDDARRRVAGRDDATVARTLARVLPAGARISRVSDFVELDQFDARVLEATRACR